MASAKTYDPANDEDLAKIIENEISQADGAESSELQAHRERALQYYNNAPRGDERDGQSQVQASDLADMTNAVLAQLTPMISNDALVVFESMGENDEDQCRMETAAIRDMVMDRNPGYIEFQQCIKDAALCRNTFAYVWAEESEHSEVRSYSGVPKSDVNALVNRLNEADGVEAQLVKEDGDKLVIEVTSTKLRYRWRAVDPINFLFQAGWEKPTLEGIRFCAEVDYPTRSECLALGYDKAAVMECPAHTGGSRSHATQRARNRTGTEQDHAYTRDQERIERHRCCILADRNGDGIAELWEVIVGDRKRILTDPVQLNFRCYASGTMFIAPHRLEGEDLYDRLKQTQDIKTHAKRRWLDNVDNLAWGRLAYNEMAVGDEIDDARAGGNIPCQGPPADQIEPVPISDASASISAVLAYEDKERSERAGAALDVISGEAQLVGAINSQGAIESQYTVREAMSAMMAANLCNTLVRDVFLLMHKTVRTHGRGAISVKLKGEEQKVEPGSFRPRELVTVTPGLTPNQRMALAQGMQLTIQGQVNAMQAGLEGVLADADGVYRAMLDFARLRGIENAEQYWIDPSSRKAQQAAERKGQQRQQQEQMRMQLMQAQMALERAKLENDRNKARLDHYAKIYQADLDAEAKEAELIAEGRQHAQDLQAAARESAKETTGVTQQ